MMIPKVLIVLCIQILSISTAPLQFQYQSQFSLQPTQEELVQQQLFALQQLQNLQTINEWKQYPPAYVQNRLPAPMMFFLPNPDLIPTQSNNLNDNEDHKDRITDNKDLESVIIEAEPHPEPQPEPNNDKNVPNAKTLSIGGIISIIPFLPIEVNVPDTVNWFYQAIANIFSGFGNRFPFNRPVPSASPEDNDVRLLLKRLQTQNRNGQMPILMLPEVAQVYPLPIPMQL